MINKFSVLSSNLITGYKPVQGSNFMEPIYIPCLTMVCETPSSRGYGYVVFTVDHAKKDVIILAQSAVRFLTNDVKNLITSLVTPKGSRTYDVDSTNTNCSLPSNNLLIDMKLDNLFFASNLMSYDYSSLKLADRDTNNVSLNAYLNQIGTLMDTQGNAITLTDAVPPVIRRKICNSMKQINWDEFWNSPYITDEEKQLCLNKLNIQIAYSNRDKDTRKLIDRMFRVEYKDRDWTFNMLHGVPGSGKTTMILNDICALNHIPCLYIIGDARASISKMIALVAPTEMPNGKVELTLTESVWAKCLKYNLPLVVFIDEIDTMTSLDLKQLAAITTSGKVTINTTHYKNDNKSVLYFGAFNPGSIDAHEFPDSMDDRLMWFSIPEVSQKEYIMYRHLIRQSAYCDPTIKQQLAKDLASKVASFKSESNNSSVNIKLDALINTLVSLDVTKCTEEAMYWFVDNQLSQIISKTPTTPTFKEGVFTDVYAHQLGGVDYDYLVSEKITMLFDKMNLKLAELTRGIQKTKRSRDAFIAIPKRAYDIFEDLIFCYSSVAKAVEFIIMNRLPSGFVLNMPGVNTKPGVDEVPLSIYKALYSYLEADIKDLHNYLFNSANMQEADDEYETYITKLQYVAPVTQQTQPGASTPSLQEQLSQENNSSQLDSWIDDLDDLDM